MQAKTRANFERSRLISCRQRIIINDFNMSQTLLVYGSMREKGKNHFRLSEANCARLGEGFINGFQLWVNPITEICYVTPGPKDSRVFVEVYSLSHVNVMEFIDQCEGHPWCYTRKLLNKKFWIYMLINFSYKRSLQPLLQKVDHGDYIQWKLDHLRSLILNH